ncbi:hypothetical protein [Bradyrhizobium sp.]
MNRHEAIAEWNSLRPIYAAKGLILPGVRMLIPDEWKHSGASIEQLAMDAAGTLGTDPNSALPAMLTTSIDPDVIRFVFAPLQMAAIMGGEVKAGDWLAETRIFPVIEHTGEISSYGDFSNNGRTGVNFNYPNFQSYLYQTFIAYGERETERADLMRINYVGELTQAAADLLNRFGNLAYAFGIVGLQNYGLINGPYLSAYLSPAIKAWGGTTWFNSGSPAATANEVYNDILAVVEQIINQTNGAVDMDAPMTLALSPQSQLAMKFTNSFGVSVAGLLKDGFPNMKVKSAPQYGQKTSTNSQGYSPVGNTFQVIVDKISNSRVAYPAFNEKLKAHKLIPEASAWKQKMTSGVWGTIMRMPVGIAGMLGV